MNEIIQAMETRRSIRKFRPDLPAKAQIDQITEAGLYAASGRGKQAVITVAESTYTNLVIQLSQPENKEICFHTPHFGKNRAHFVGTRHDSPVVSGNLSSSGSVVPGPYAHFLSFQHGLVNWIINF